MRPKALLSWSSGKDSAWTLHVLRQVGEVDVVALLTTINSVHDRVAMHAVRTELLRLQAEAVGVALWTVPIPSPCSNAQYEAAMSSTLVRAHDAGITVMAFGDLFLEDIRRYRGEKLAGSGLSPIFPIWCFGDRWLCGSVRPLNAMASYLPICSARNKKAKSRIGPATASRPRCRREGMLRRRKAHCLSVRRDPAQNRRLGHTRGWYPRG